jgi:hypothetical protein
MKIIEKCLPASELPIEWQREGEFAPEDEVHVRIEPKDTELAEAASLAALMDIIGRRMQARGLTPEKLEDILRDE